MKKTMTTLILLLFLGIAFPNTAFADDEKDKEDKSCYEFTPIKMLKTTSVKDQYKSGTCWSFSALSFVETELLRLGKPEYDLSEMFVVRTSYTDKAKQYVRWHGNRTFAPGGNFHDIMLSWKNYGLVPEEAYPGLEYGEEKHKHGELDALLNSYVNTVIKNRNKTLSPVWIEGYNGILDAYLGDYPDSFTFKGKTYSPKTFASSLGINPDDYIELTSYNHHPYYEQFVLELPDNWANCLVYNVPLDDLIDIIDNAVENGYSVAWGGDVSSKGFNFKKHGIGVVLKDEFEDSEGSEMSKWDDVPYRSRMDSLYNFTEIREEKEITPEIRQKAFDSWDVTDDHGMHIVGTAKDQEGNLYYYTKNSWNDDSNLYDGYLYMSVPYVKLNTTAIMIHKDALPAGIKSKLGVK